ncbi:MAG: hypothetical protein JRI91_02540 [Deltaproteobacteria bacterium]|nr:hypothetical protein [Deltaproteobacteria bacterium]
MENKSTYTCNKYREEMMLLCLKKRLVRETLTEEEKQIVKVDIQKLESAMGME